MTGDVPQFGPNPALDAQLAATGLPVDEAFAALVAAEESVGRSCGDCTVCCRVVGVPELDKSPGRSCAHVAPACGGCAIYANRPGGCRAYACAWKLGLADDDDRPDRVGGLLEWHELDASFHPFGGHWVFRPDAVGGPERDLPDASRDLLDRLLALGCLVLVYRGAGERLVMLYPDGSIDDEAGVAPTWAAEQAGEVMGFRVAYWDSYAPALTPDVVALVESGELPFAE